MTDAPTERPIRVGTIDVHRVEELVMPTSMRWLFPEIEDGRPIVEANRDWLAPHFLNERGHLLQSCNIVQRNASLLTGSA